VHLTPEARSLSVGLLAVVMFNMSLFYLVNFPHRPIRVQTWKTLDMTLSIFCSVLIFSIFDKTAVALLMPFLGLEFIHLSLFLTSYVALQALLYFLKDKSQGLRLIAASQLCAHVTGFAAMQGFAAFFEFFPHCPPCSIIVLVCATAVLILLQVVTHKIRITIANADGIIDEDEERWHEQVIDCEDDVTALCISFLLCQVILFNISGQMPAWEAGEIQPAITQGKANILFLVCIAFVCIIGGLSNMSHLWTWLVEANPVYSRAFRVFLSISSMAFGWCFLFWGEWQVLLLTNRVRPLWSEWQIVDELPYRKFQTYERKTIGSALCIAICMTELSLMLIFVCDFVMVHLRGSSHTTDAARRGFRSVILAGGIVIGFSWEQAFDVALENISEMWVHGWERTSTLFLSLAILLIVLPAWRLYILPKDVSENTVGDKAQVHQ